MMVHLIFPHQTRYALAPNRAASQSRPCVTLQAGGVGHVSRAVRNAAQTRRNPARAVVHSPIPRERRARLDVPVGVAQLGEAQRGADLGGAHARAHVLLVSEEQQRHGTLGLLWRCSGCVSELLPGAQEHSV